MRTIHWLLLSALSLGTTHVVVGAETREGDWFTRVRGLYILPNDHSSQLNVVKNGYVSVNPSFTGEFDVGYMLTDTVGCELILGTTKNSIHGKKALRGIPIGSSWLLPPTLTLQYHPCSFSPILKPYLGVGVNYTLFYSEKSAIKDTQLSLESSWGPAVQIGTDLFFHEEWCLNLDVKYVWAKSMAHLKGALNAHTEVTLNPWLFGVGIGRKW